MQEVTRQMQEVEKDTTHLKQANTSSRNQGRVSRNKIWSKKSLYQGPTDLEWMQIHARRVLQSRLSLSDTKLVSGTNAAINMRPKSAANSDWGKKAPAPAGHLVESGLIKADRAGRCPVSG